MVMDGRGDGVCTWAGQVNVEAEGRNDGRGGVGGKMNVKGSRKGVIALDPQSANCEVVREVGKGSGQEKEKGG